MPRERRGANKSKERGGEGPKNKANGNTGVRNTVSPSQAKRRAVQCSPTLPDLFPPPLSGPGENIVANNPFSDPRHQQSPLVPLQSPQGFPGPQPLHPLSGGGGPGGGPQHPYSMHQKHGGMHGPPMPPASMAPGGSKVYPPNQPMVFNPSNPNAPPIYPCGICHKEVHDNDQAVLCESGCNFWFHRSCTGLSEPAYQMLTQEVYAEWVCDKCLQTKNIPLVKLKP